MTKGTGIIVVGVDGSSSNDAALAFAIEEARRTGDTVQVVTAWQPDVRVPGSEVPHMLAADRAEAEGLQRAALARVGDVSDLVVSQEVVTGRADLQLVEAARGARMLVVGSRAMGPLRALILGSVSRYCAQRAPCPIVVVPERSAEELAGQAVVQLPVAAPSGSSR